MSITKNAMLVELNIGGWTASRLDRGVSEEIDVSKNTKARAGNYRKNLLPDSKELDTIRKFVGNIRNWHYSQTIPWTDSGLRLLTLKQYVDYTSKVNTLMSEFDTMKRNFVTEYPNLISAAAFTLGDLFQRDEYPSQDEVDRKFYFNVCYYPLSESGDFRVDVGNEALSELAESYEKNFAEKLNSAMADIWDRLHSTLKHLSDRLEVTETGDKKIFRDSLLENAHELCGLLSNLNVTNDPKLEEARRDLEQALLGVTTKDLRESVLIRQDVHTRVQQIINKFDF